MENPPENATSTSPQPPKSPTTPSKRSKRSIFSYLFPPTPPPKFSPPSPPPELPASHSKMPSYSLQPPKSPEPPPTTTTPSPNTPTATATTTTNSKKPIFSSLISPTPPTKLPPSPFPPPQLPIRHYKIRSASSWSRRFKITCPSSASPDTVLYHLKFTTSVKPYTMILHTGDPKAENPIVVAATKVSMFKNTTPLSVGVGGSGGSNSSAKSIDMKLNSMWKHNSYDLSFPVLQAEGMVQDEKKMLDLQWKGTHEVQGFMNQLDLGMHHKLVEKMPSENEGSESKPGVKHPNQTHNSGNPNFAGTRSGRLLARYIHDSWSMDVAGVVEILAVPEGVVDEREWDLFVLLGALAVAEKTRQTMATFRQAA